MVEKTTLDLVWMIVCAGLVFLMQAGFTCLESGLTRSKNSINVAIKNIADFGLSACLFWAFGFALMFGTTSAGWFGTSDFFVSVDRGHPWLAAFFLFQVMFCGTAVTIVSGAVAERMRFVSYLLIVLVLSGLIYPLFGHWAWSPGDGAALWTNQVGPSSLGWLSQLGFVDFAGSTVVHSVGGWVALAAVCVIGPREGRFPERGPARRIQGHSLPIAAVGALLLWLGWLGFNGGSTFAAEGSIPSVITKTVLSGAAGLLAALVLGWLMERRADVELIINGLLAGLVAITASCHVVSTATAMFVGAVATVVMFGVNRLLERLRIDDVVGAIAVHAGAGVWGTLALGLFGDQAILDTGLSRSGQVGVQLLGIVVCFVWSFGMASLVLWNINRFVPLRVTPDQERDGLNVSEHGATTELYDLFKALDQQAARGDIRMRAPVEPFTEVGQIATLYNRVLDALEQAEERFRKAVQSAPNAMLLVDPMGQIVLANSEAEQLFGYARDELVGKPVERLVPDRFRRDHESHRTHYFADPQLRSLGTGRELSGKKKDGTEVPVEIGLSPVYTDKETLVLSSIVDITQRHQTETELRESEARFKTLVEHSAEAIMLLDVDAGRFADANDRALQLFEVSRAQFLRMHPVDLSPPMQPDGRSSTEAARAQIEKALTDGVAVFDWTHRTASGQDVPCEVRLVPLPSKDRKIVRASVADITARKQFEDALDQARDAAEQASRAKSEFLAKMSHEIRTPMNGVIGMLTLLDNTIVTSQQQEYVGLAKQSADSLLRLLNDILDFSKIEAGKLELEESPFKLRDLIGDTLQAVPLRTDGGACELTYHIRRDVPDSLIGDPGRLRQIIVNLVGNAIKFTEEGEISVNVLSEAMTEREVCLHFTVSDTGIGIPAVKQQHIFEAFSQADSSTTRRFGGTGLGLAISKQLVDMMGGQMGLDSQEGKGSTFSFTAKFRLPSNALAPPPPPPASLKDSPVLIVDDHATNRLAFAEMLTQGGLTANSAGDGPAAMHALHVAASSPRPYRLVVLDARMPSMDGLVLAAQIRADPKLAHVSLLLLSTTESVDADRCEELKIARRLRKPVKHSELLDAVMLALDPSTATVEGEKLSSRKPQKVPRPARILLVEDGLINQKVAVDMLHLQGHSVVIADNGKKALATLAAESFDLILMDVEMPEMDGVETTSVIRDGERETGDHVPIVAMTAHALKGDRERLLEAGMDAYLSKPIDQQQLYKIVEDLVSAAGCGAAVHPAEMGRSKTVDDDVVNPASTSRDEESATPSVIDLELARQRIPGDSKMLSEIAELLRAECPRLLEGIRQALADQDAGRLRREAHTLKSSVGLVGANRVVETAFKLETMGRDGDLRGAEPTVIQLEREVAQLTSALESLATPGE